VPDVELKSLQVIAQWRDAGYHLQPEHVAFAQLLQSAPSDASVIMRDRFPAARFIECDQNSSQVRLPPRLGQRLHHQHVVPGSLSSPRA
jgi:hypothetical protein